MAGLGPQPHLAGPARREVSQSQLGEGLGVTFQQVQKYAKCRNRVAAGVLQIIAERLKMPVQWLIGLKANGHSAEAGRRQDQKRNGNCNVDAIVETLARMDKKSVAAVREIVEQISKLV
jgi:transcriptional regulator with XRE-family HTH domain